ncbi:quinolinate synthase NadA [Methanorbis rubei]|uniref:Quinolinate synthase n=1 Tax=Methanorbis rubei TaxID=3028300 RepID=A0AAE4MF63_9EURY|nr:Quinolinate synthase A [Methanocorpusculaceae archaeon Cs1]
MNYEQQIKKLAAEKNAVILAHNYQPPEIQDAADITGDSLELARLAKEAKESTLVLCGVYFMAETAKILSPEKTVLIPRPDAGCPLADQLTPEIVRAAKAAHPGSPFVVYVNSNAATKAECDITCTSANAAAVAASLPEKKILFGPDANLAAWVQAQLPDKEIIPVPPNGGCPTHHNFSVRDVEIARREYPDATIICHPECSREVQLASDMVGSTGYMIRNCGTEKEWVIFTEEGIAHPLRKKYPDTIFHVMASAVCPNMKLIDLSDLYVTLRDGVYPVQVSDHIAAKARTAIERMIEVSK